MASVETPPITKAKVNPFHPDEPIPPKFFVGRRRQIETINAALNQTAAGSPQDVLVLGEKWLGKSSLANYASEVARRGKEYHLIGCTFNAVTCRLGACRTLDEICVTVINGLHRRIQNGLRETVKGWLSAINGLSVGPFGLQFNAQGRGGHRCPSIS